MPRQTLVNEGVVGRQKLEHAPVVVQHALEEQLGLSLERHAKRLAEVGKPILVGRQGPHVAEIQPLPGEVLNQRGGPAIGQHPPGLGLKHRRLVQGSRDGHVEELVVRNATPEEERQPRGQFEITDTIRCPGCNILWIAFDAKQKLRTRQQSPYPEFDTCLEPTVGLPLVVEAEQHVEVALRHRPAIGTPRQRRQDLPSASGGVATCRTVRYVHTGSPRCGVTREDPLATRSLVDRPTATAFERAGDSHAADIRLIPRVAAGDAGVGTQERPSKRLRISSRFLMKRHLHRVGTGSHRRAHFPLVVDGSLARQIRPIFRAAPLDPLGRDVADDKGL